MKKKSLSSLNPEHFYPELISIPNSLSLFKIFSILGWKEKGRLTVQVLDINLVLYACYQYKHRVYWLYFCMKCSCDDLNEECSSDPLVTLDLWRRIKQLPDSHKRHVTLLWNSVSLSSLVISGQMFIVSYYKGQSFIFWESISSFAQHFSLSIIQFIVSMLAEQTQ